MSISSDSKPSLYPHPLLLYALLSPGTSKRDVSQDKLLFKNHNEHDMFFIKARGFYKYVKQSLVIPVANVIQPLDPSLSSGLFFRRNGRQAS